jgi:hypothetical protein
MADMRTKMCTRCNKKKTLLHFTKNRQQKDGHSCYCKSCTKILVKTRWKPDSTKKKKAQAKYARSDKGRRVLRNASYKHRYGISLDVYEEMFNEQEGKCKMCNSPSDKLLVVDHDHITNKVRGLLCQRCNCFLGYIESDGLLIKLAKLYLRGV